MARHKKISLPIEDRVEQVKTITGKLIENYYEAMEIEAMLSRINDDNEFRALFVDSYEGHGLNVVYNSLLHQLVVVLARMYDFSDPDRGQGTDRASLHHVMHLVSDKDVLRVFVEDARLWTPQIERMEENNARIAAKAVQRARVRFRRLVSNPESDKWLREIRRFRDHFVAHSLFDMDEEVNLLYGYIGNLLISTGTILEPLRLGIEGSSWEIADFQKEDRQKANAFWMIVEKGMAEHRRDHS